MKRTIGHLTGVVSCCVAVAAGLGCVFADSAPPVPQFKAVDVTSDGRITLRCYAPYAHAVSIGGPLSSFVLDASGTRLNIVMTKGDDGVWAGTFGLLPADDYEYDFTVDGLSQPDPRNDRMHGLLSILTVPGPNPTPWQQQQTPHGSIVTEYYDSKILGMTRRLHVYLPPGYDAHRRARYPVLYLLHGSGGDDADWTLISGSANFIFDNLLAEHKMQPMIVVMPNGSLPATLDRSERGSAFTEEVLHEIIPLIESQYLTKADARHRAVAGLSMGGYQARLLGLGADAGNTFQYVGMFSPGGFSGSPYLDADPTQVNARVKLIWLSVGNRDSVVGGYTQHLEDWLVANHVAHQYHSYLGDHVWNVWRRSLTEFAPLLFQPDAP